MRRFIAFLLVLCAAMVVGAVVAHWPGFIVLAVGTFSIAVPLWLACFTVFLVAVALFWLFCVVRGIYRVPTRIHYMWQHHRLTRQQKHLAQGMNSLVLSNWREAEGHFKKLSRSEFLPAQSLSMAAWCANHNSSAPLTSDKLIQDLDKITVEHRDELLVALVKIDRLIAVQDYANALTSLQNLKQEYPKNINVIKRLIEVLCASSDFNQANQLLEALPRADKPQQSVEWQQKIACGLLQQAMAQGKEALMAAWGQLKVAAQSDQEVVRCYIEGLKSLKGDAQALEWLKKHLKKHPSDVYFSWMCALHVQDINGLIQVGCDYLKKHTATADNQLAIGLLYQRAQMLGPAQAHLEKSLALKPSSAALVALSKIHRHQQDLKTANVLLEKAVELD